MEFTKLGINVFYARETLDDISKTAALKEGGVDMMVRCKTKAIGKAWMRSQRQAGTIGDGHRRNLISIGDSQIEVEATKEVAWGTDDDNLCKTVKLREASSAVDGLTSQLKELLPLIPSMTLVTEDFDM